MSVTGELLANNARYAATFGGPLPPARQLAVVACMDARLNVYAILGLREGEAQASPFILHKDAVHGFVFDIATGQLAEVK
jgi:carbonic anhydrase